MKSINDLTDGVVLFEIMSKVLVRFTVIIIINCNRRAPDRFDLNALRRDTQGNWECKLSNLQALHRGIVEYYSQVLGLSVQKIGLTQIARYVVVRCWYLSVRILEGMVTWRSWWRW